MGTISNTGVFLLVFSNCVLHVCHAVKLLSSDNVLLDHLHKAKACGWGWHDVLRKLELSGLEIRVAIYTALLEPRGVEKGAIHMSVSNKQRLTETETETSGYYWWSQGKILWSTFKMRCKDKFILQYVMCFKRIHKGGIEWMMEGST